MRFFLADGEHIAYRLLRRFLEVEIYKKSDQGIQFAFAKLLSRRLYSVTLVARLCWEVFVHKMTTVSFDVVRHNAIQDGTCRCEFYPPHAPSQDFSVHETIEIVIAQSLGYLASVFVVSFGYKET